MGTVVGRLCGHHSGHCSGHRGGHRGHFSGHGPVPHAAFLQPAMQQVIPLMCAAGGCFSQFGSHIVRVAEQFAGQKTAAAVGEARSSRSSSGNSRSSKCYQCCRGCTNGSSYSNISSSSLFMQPVAAASCQSCCCGVDFSGSLSASRCRCFSFFRGWCNLGVCVGCRRGNATG